MLPRTYHWLMGHQLDPPAPERHGRGMKASPHMNFNDAVAHCGIALSGRCTVAQDCERGRNVSSEGCVHEVRWSNPSVQDMGVKMASTICVQFDPS